ncbi:MAG: hypothetical protein OXJ52_02820 [Oligoflexia bacterium]|nr:hypothetical protein [Oligoflexia bacterium]
MRLVFIFLFFSSVLFQAQAQVLIEYPINQNMDQFDWQAFVIRKMSENIQKGQEIGLSASSSKK